MKKILLVVAVCLAAIPAFAQLNVKASTKSKQIAAFRMGVITVHLGSHGYYMALTTNNQFDKSAIFRLGEDKEAATKTLDDLMSILESGDTDTAVFVESSPGKECMLTIQKQLGVPSLWFKVDGCAGSQGLTMGELKKVRDAVNK